MDDGQYITHMCGDIHILILISIVIFFIMWHINYLSKDDFEGNKIPSYNNFYHFFSKNLRKLKHVHHCHDNNHIVITFLNNSFYLT